MTSSAPSELRRDDLQRLARHERAREVAHLAVLAHGERGAREARADRGGRVGAGRAVGELELGSVGKGDVHEPIVTPRPYARRTARRGRGARRAPAV